VTTRDRIKAEAMRLFVEHGIDAVSVRDIAAAVGMKASNLYAHFPAKAALIQELFAEGYQAYASVLAETGGQTCIERLDAMVRRICALHDADITRFRFLLLTQHGTTLPRDTPGPVDEVQTLITQGMTSGEIPAGDAVLVTAMLVGVVIEAATFRLYGRLDRDMVAMADEIVAACRRIVGRN